MADEIIVQIQKRFRGGAAIHADFRLNLAAGSTVILFGPSGSGKTTVLRCIAGLETPDYGLIRFRDEVWFDSSHHISHAPQRRRAGFLYQDYALFPHLTVRQNIAYGLGRRSLPERRHIVDEVMRLFEIRELAERLPPQLSGGQAQRVALARAVAPQPCLLLLDEPLAALDLPTRARLRTELRRLLETIGIPSLLVTHDRTEAISLGRQIVIMADGEVRQVGAVDEVFRRPADATVANTVGVETILRGVIVDSQNGLARVQVNLCQICAVPKEDFRSGDTVLVCIRAEEVTLQKEARTFESARNHFPGNVVLLESDGPVERVTIDCGFPLVAMITRNALEEMNFQMGSAVTAAVKATAVHLIRT
jgi:molybdate transport system ATP-binding protein